MGVRFHCDAPGCAERRGGPGSYARGVEATASPARTTALEVPGMRDRENPADRPVVYLPPIGWTPIAMKDGRRLYACSAACRDDITGKDGRDPTGRRIGASCPACGQSVDGGEGGA